jgi:hypothetical protein
MIEIAPDNHISTLTKWSESSWVEPIPVFLLDLECEEYQDEDLDPHYACKHEGEFYYDPSTIVCSSVMQDDSSTEFNIAMLHNKPDWATHIHWSSK